MPKRIYLKDKGTECGLPGSKPKSPPIKVLSLDSNDQSSQKKDSSLISLITRRK
jgi:hypothetical protein